MKKSVLKLVFSFLVLLIANTGNAQQKDIVLSDYLLQNSEKLKVKMGAAWFGKMFNMKFGDYEVKKSKARSKKSSSASNFWNTRIETDIGYKFNFEFVDKKSESAIVNVVYSEKIMELQSFRISDHFSIGSDMILMDSVNYTANIYLKSNEAEVWNLQMFKINGFDLEFVDGGYLTTGDRVIRIDFVTSADLGGDKRRIPAIGYRFVEDGKSIGALQYYAGGMLGLNKNYVRIDKNLDRKTKLVLAASMTTILEIIYSEIEKMEMEITEIYYQSFH